MFTKRSSKVNKLQNITSSPSSPLSADVVLYPLRNITNDLCLTRNTSYQQMTVAATISADNAWNKAKFLGLKEKFKVLCKVMKNILGDKVEMVIVSDRVDAPPCYFVTDDDFEWIAKMEGVMLVQTIVELIMDGCMIIAINPSNSIVKELRKKADADKYYNDKSVKDAVLLLFKTALFTSKFFGLDKPYTFINPIHRMLLKAFLSIDEDSVDSEAAPDMGKTMEVHSIIMEELRKRANADKNDKSVQDLVELLSETAHLTLFRSTLSEPNTFANRVHKMLKVVLRIDEDSADADADPDMTPLVDADAVGQLKKFEDKKLVSAIEEGLKLDDSEDEKKKEKFKGLCMVISAYLGGQVDKVIVSDRVVDSPCYLDYQYQLTDMETMMTVQALRVDYNTMVINPEDSIMQELRKRSDADKHNRSLIYSVQLLFETAVVTSGFNLYSPITFANRIHMMLEMVLSVIDPDIPPLEDVYSIIMGWLKLVLGIDEDGADAYGSKTMINHEHSIIMEELMKRANADKNDKFVEDLLVLLCETACLTLGFSLGEPKIFGNRIHRMLAFLLSADSEADPDMPPLEDAYAVGQLKESKTFGNRIHRMLTFLLSADSEADEDMPPLEDSYAVGQLKEFEGKKLVSAT